MIAARAADDPLAALLVPYLVERTAAQGERALGAADPERTLAEVPDWGWLLGVVASSLGCGLSGERRERGGLALLARALDGALAAEGRGLGQPLEPWPALAAHAEDGWSATWTVGRVLLWSARGPAGPGSGPGLAITWERRGEHGSGRGSGRVVLRARSGDPALAPELGRALDRSAPEVTLTSGSEHCELSLPAAWFAEHEPC